MPHVAPVTWFVNRNKQVTRVRCSSINILTKTLNTHWLKYSEDKKSHNTAGRQSSLFPRLSRNLYQLSKTLTDTQVLFGINYIYYNNLLQFINAQVAKPRNLRFNCVTGRLEPFMNKLINLSVIGRWIFIVIKIIKRRVSLLLIQFLYSSSFILLLFI